MRCVILILCIWWALALVSVLAICRAAHRTPDPEPEVRDAHPWRPLRWQCEHGGWLLL